MAKYDVEQFVRDVDTIFQSNLNAEITAINTDKGDFSVDTLASGAWYISAIPETWSYPQFGMIVITDMETNSVMVTEADTVTLMIVVVIPDNGEAITEAMLYKLLRYQRALRQVAQKNFDKLRGHAKLEVSNLTPTSDELLGKRVIGAGISVKASFNN